MESELAWKLSVDKQCEIRKNKHQLLLLITVNVWSTARKLAARAQPAFSSEKWVCVPCFQREHFFQCCFLTASRLSCTQSPVAVNIHLRETMDHGVAPVHNTAAYVEKPDCLVRRKGKACAYFCFNNLNFRSWDAHRLRNQKSLLGQVAHMAFHSLIQMPPRLIYSITMHLTVNIHHSGDLLGYWAHCGNKNDNGDA